MSIIKDNIQSLKEIILNGISILTILPEQEKSKLSLLKDLNNLLIKKYNRLHKDYKSIVNNFYKQTKSFDLNTKGNITFSEEQLLSLSLYEIFELERIEYR